MSESIEDVLQKMELKFDESFSIKEPIMLKQENPETNQNDDDQIINNEIQNENQQDNPMENKQEQTTKQQMKEDDQELIKQNQSKNKREDYEQKHPKKMLFENLTSKLERALEKISSQKKIDNKEVMSRFDYYEEKRQKQIKNKKEQIAKEIKAQYRDVPEINSNSRVIANSCGVQPIYNRAYNIHQKYMNKIKNEYQEKKIKKQQEEEEAEKDFHKHMIKIAQKHKNKRTENEFYEDMEKWAHKKSQQRIQQQKQKEQKQLQNVTFQPTLNNKSCKMLKKDRVPIYNREIKPRNQPIDLNCTFQPKINKNSIRYAKNGLK